MATEEQPLSSETSLSTDTTIRARARAVVGEVVARLKQNPLVNSAIIITACVSIVVLAMTLPHLMPTETPEQPTVTLDHALAALDANRTDLARQLVAEIPQEDLPADQAGGRAYVAGAALTHDAFLLESPPQRRALLRLASRYLEEAQALGFPSDRKGHGEFLLGKSLVEIGRYDEGIAPLTAAITSYPQEDLEARRLLVSALLHATPRQLEAARRDNRSYLDDKRLTDAQRSRALLTHAEILFELGDVQACHDIIAQVAPNSAEYSHAALLDGRLLMQQADQLAKNAGQDAQAAWEAADVYAAAQQAFQTSIDARRRDRDALRMAHYFLGVVLKRRAPLLAADNAKQELIAAAKQCSYTRRVYMHTNEGVAANLEEAEVLQLLDQHEEVIASYRTLFEQAGDARSYRNPWLPFDELRSRIDRAYSLYHEAKAYDQAITLAEALADFFPLDRSLELQAKSHEAMGRERLQQAVELSRTEAAPIANEGRIAHRRAGKLYAELATERFATHEYPDQLWNSAENYRLADDHRNAARLYRRYLDNERRNKHPRALTALGESLLALSKPEEARPYLAECIETFPDDPYLFRAQNLAAQAEREVGNLEAAEDLLLRNIEHELLDPDSAEGLEALFLMGELLYEKGLRHETTSRLRGVDDPVPANRRAGLDELELAHAAFQEAVSRLQERRKREEFVVDRITPRDKERRAEQMIAARYMIAESHRHAAKLPRKTLPGVTIEATAANLNNKIHDELSTAAEIYQELIDALVRRDKDNRTASEDRVLRNSYFGRADVLFDMGRYTEAIDAYLDAAGHGEAEPAALEAHVQVANCYRQLNQLEHAEGAIQTARLALARISPEADFRRTTRYSRDEWTQLLDWLSEL